MIAEIIEKNKNMLHSTGSYLVPGIDQIIDLMRTVENDAGETIFSALHPVQYSKGDYLLREGAPCWEITLLETGIARQFVNKKGYEPIACFFFPGEFITNRRFRINTMSKVNIQFETNATGYSMSWANLEKLKRAYPMLAEIEKLAFEFKAYWLSDRFYQMAFSTARERYKNLLLWPQILLQQLSITHTANYLNISIETLSRIRKDNNFQ